MEMKIGKGLEKEETWAHVDMEEVRVPHPNAINGLVWAKVFSLVGGPLKYATDNQKSCVEIKDNKVMQLIKLRLLLVFFFEAGKLR